MKGGAIHARRWDLDHIQHVNEWQLLKHPAPGSENHIGLLEGLEHGTLILWEKSDRLVDLDASASDGKAQESFFRMIKEVKDYLAGGGRANLGRRGRAKLVHPVP